MGTAAAAVFATLVAVMLLTAHPAKNCTWQYEHFGKGAYAAQCFANTQRHP